MGVIKVWKTMKAIIGIAFVLFIVFVVIALLSTNDKSDKVKSYKNVNVSTMIQAYADNEAKGDEIYKDKYIKFSGEVTKISSGVVSGATISIDSDIYGMGGVDVDVSLKDAGKLSKGQTVTVEGQVTGRIMQTIQVADGKVVK